MSCNCRLQRHANSNSLAAFMYRAKWVSEKDLLVIPSSSSSSLSASLPSPSSPSSTGIDISSRPDKNEEGRVEISEDTLKAYYRTNYCISHKGYVYPPMKVGRQVHCELVRLFAQYNVHSLVFITAWNPRSKLQTPEENYTSQAMLIEELYKHELHFFQDCMGIECRDYEPDGESDIAFEKGTETTEGLDYRTRDDDLDVKGGDDHVDKNSKMEETISGMATKLKDKKGVNVEREVREIGGQIPGAGDHSLWREESVCVLNITREFAASLAFKYGQMSVLWVDNRDSEYETISPESTSAFVPKLLFLKELPLKNDQCDANYDYDSTYNCLRESLQCMEISREEDNFSSGVDNKKGRRRVPIEEM